MTREEAIENLKMIHFSFINPSTEEQRHIITDTFEMAIEALKQEPKTGHLRDVDGGVECSKCGKFYPHAPIAKNEIKYCCECGAKMESEG